MNAVHHMPLLFLLLGYVRFMDMVKGISLSLYSSFFSRALLLLYVAVKLFISLLALMLLLLMMSVRTWGMKASLLQRRGEEEKKSSVLKYSTLIKCPFIVGSCC